MPVNFETFEAAERKTKGGGVRPSYKYDGVKRDSVRADSADNLLADLLEVSGGDLGKIADFVVEGFNSLAEKAANPLKDETVKAVIAAMKSVGQAVDIARAREIAATFKAKGAIS